MLCKHNLLFWMRLIKINHLTALISSHSSQLKTDVFLYFGGNGDAFSPRILWWIESSKEQHVFEIKSFVTFINVFSATLDQFHVSLLNKSINFFQKQNLTCDSEKLCYIKIYLVHFSHCRLKATIHTKLTSMKLGCCGCLPVHCYAVA